MKSPHLGNKCWSNTHSLRIHYLLCRDATGWSLQSTIFQTFPLESLSLAWSWDLKCWNNYLSFLNLQSCTGQMSGRGRARGAAALFPCLFLPTSASQCTLRMRRSWSLHWRTCQNAASGSEAAGLASPQALSSGKGRVWVAHPSKCYTPRWTPSSLLLPSSAQPCCGLRGSSWKQTQTSNKRPDFHNHTCKNASTVA